MQEIFPGQFTPSPSHCFIASLERKGKLLRNYTQNIDTLEQAAGITRVIQCHGTLCTTCVWCEIDHHISVTLFLPLLFTAAILCLCIPMYSLAYFSHLSSTTSGSFLTATCTRCKYSVPGDDIKEDIMNEASCTSVYASQWLLVVSKLIMFSDVVELG